MVANDEDDDDGDTAASAAVIIIVVVILKFDLPRESRFVSLHPQPGISHE